MYYVYVLKNKFGRKYIGYTTDLQKRLKEHNTSSVKSTKLGRPWNIVYTEKYKEREFAKRRERYLKSHTGRRKIDMICPS